MTIRDLQYKTQELIDAGIKDSAEVKLDGDKLVAVSENGYGVLADALEVRVNGGLRRAISTINREIERLSTVGGARNIAAARSLLWAVGACIDAEYPNEK